MNDSSSSDRPPSRGDDVSPSLLDFIKNIRDQPRHVKLALLSSISQTVVLITLESIVSADYSSELSLLQQNSGALANLLNQPLADPTMKRAEALSLYYVLFILAQIFQVILCVDAVINKNTIQVFGLVLYNFMLLVYSIIQIIQANSLLSPDVVQELTNAIPGYQHLTGLPITYAIAVLMFLYAVGFALQGWKLYKEFGWSIYKKIGADIRMRRMYMIYQIFIMILKFDVFMLLSFSLQWLAMLLNEASVSGDYTQVVVHSIVSFGGSICMFVLAFWAIRNESKIGMILVFIIDIATMAYFIQKLVVMQYPYSIPGTPCIQGQALNTCDRYDGSRNFFTLFLSVDLILGFVTLVIAVIAFRNFGRGLKSHISMKKKKHNEDSQDMIEAPRRWTIE